MARFIVVVLQYEETDVETIEAHAQELVPCEDLPAIRDVLARVRHHDQDWNLFELVDGKYVSRAVTRNPDMSIKELS